VTLTEELRHKNADGSQTHFGQAFFLKLHELVSTQYPNIQKLWLIGGGDDKTAKLREHFYKDILGGESVVNLKPKNSSPKKNHSKSKSRWKQG
jgi:hypothetical protein